MHVFNKYINIFLITRILKTRLLKTIVSNNQAFENQDFENLQVSQILKMIKNVKMKAQCSLTRLLRHFNI